MSHERPGRRGRAARILDIVYRGSVTHYYMTSRRRSAALLPPERCRRRLDRRRRRALRVGCREWCAGRAGDGMTSPDRRSAPKPTRMENCSFWAAQLPAGHSRPLWHRLAAGEGSGFATVRVSALSRQRGIQMTGVTRYLCCCDGRCYWVACVLRSTAKAKSGALGFCLGAQLSSYLPAGVKGRAGPWIYGGQKPNCRVALC